MNYVESFNQSIGVLDTETTGISDSDDIIEFSIMLNSDGNTSFFTSLFKSTNPVPAESSSVHWICDEDLVTAPEFSETAPLLGTLMDQMQYLVGHNVEFDRNMLEQNYKVKCSTVPDSVTNKNKWIDTCKLAKKLYREDKRNFDNMKLSYLWFKLQLNKKTTRKINPHSAEDDVFMCYMLLQHMVEDFITRGDVDPSKDIGPQLITLCNTPNLLETCFLKKHKGKTFAEVAQIDMPYLKWMISSSDLLNENMPGFDIDLAHTVMYYVEQSLSQ